MSAGLLEKLSRCHSKEEKIIRTHVARMTNHQKRQITRCRFQNEKEFIIDFSENIQIPSS